jgi:hypothetical protein
MRSEKLAELVRGYADGLLDAAHRACEQVFAAVDWHDSGTPVGVAHHVVAAVDSNDSEADTLESLDNLRSRRGRDATRHKAGSYQKSGYVECQSQLIWWPNLLKQQLQAGA